MGRNKNKIYNLLLNTVGAGPLDGGCVVFAHALQLRYGGAVWVLTRADGSADHAVLKTGRMLIDADGPAGSVQELITRFNSLEHADTVAARPYRVGDLPESPFDPALARKIAELFGGNRE